MASARTVDPPVAFNLDVHPPKIAAEFDVVEKEGGFDITADMRGDENVRLGVTKDRVIHIVSEKNATSEAVGAEAESKKQEGPEISRQRAIPLPENVDETKATAYYKDGELHMSIPKRGALDTTDATRSGGTVSPAVIGNC